jgi:vacuolar iron transporter family protein
MAPDARPRPARPRHARPPTVRRHQTELHRTSRTGWLRATVLGANDGILSTGALLLGVAGAGAGRSALITAGVAALVAGAMSMGIGEYVSVSSQKDAEHADRAMEAAELEDDPVAETAELRAIYQARGLSHDLAQEVADALMEHDALGAHLRDELGHTEELRARPLQAALASFGAFALGASIPLLTAVLIPEGGRVAGITVATVVGMVALGAVGASLGGASRLRGALRVGIGGSIALAVTYGVGRLFGTAIG